FGPDVTDHEAAGCAAEAAIGHEADIVSESLADDGGSHAEHFAHARATARAVVADDDRVFLFDLLRLDGGHALLFAFEAAGRAAMLQLLHPGGLDHASFRRQISTQDVQSARLFQGPRDRHDDVLILLELDAGEILRHGSAGAGHGIAVDEFLIQQRSQN